LDRVGGFDTVGYDDADRLFEEAVAVKGFLEQRSQKENSLAPLPQIYETFRYLAAGIVLQPGLLQSGRSWSNLTCYIDISEDFDSARPRDIKMDSWSNESIAHQPRMEYNCILAVYEWSQ
jgi:hypothetical protein